MRALLWPPPPPAPLPLRMVLVLALGCSGDGGADAPDGGLYPDAAVDERFCDGGQPEMAACFEGDFFAECGGAGPPRFACRTGLDGTRCAWFSGGCVAAGFVASPCPADNLCCLAGWPFPSGGGPVGLYGRLYGMGLAPWDRQRAQAVDVVLDPALVAGETTYVCSGTDPAAAHPNNPCNGWLGHPTYLHVRDTFTVATPGNGVAGWFPWIEIDASAATPRARVSSRPYTDETDDSCPDRGDPHCATAGTVTVSRLPTSMADASGVSVALDVTYAEGFRLEGAFVIP